MFALRNKNRSTISTRAIRRSGRNVVLNTFLKLRKQEEEHRPPPDFVIVGAQRCGTTSLFRALAKHPATMPNVINAKGVHYFDTSYHKPKEWYFAHFPSFSERENHSKSLGHRAISGEASPYYLFHPTGPERMAKIIPNAKIIVLLRNPTKRAISHYQHMVWEGHEHLNNIDDALNAEYNRLNGVEEQLIADPYLISKAHQHYSYIARGHYVRQLKHLYSFYDRKNVLVVTTEQMIAESELILSKVQNFIGLEAHPEIRLEKKNASSSFTTKPETVKRLNEEYLQSNNELKGLVDCEIPWI